MLAEARQIRIEQLHQRRLLAGLSPRCGPSGEHNDSDTDSTDSFTLDYLDLPVTYSVILVVNCLHYSWVHLLLLCIIVNAIF